MYQDLIFLTKFYILTHKNLKFKNEDSKLEHENINSQCVLDIYIII